MGCFDYTIVNKRSGNNISIHFSSYTVYKLSFPILCLHVLFALNRYKEANIV